MSSERHNRSGPGTSGVSDQEMNGRFLERRQEKDLVNGMSTFHAESGGSRQKDENQIMKHDVHRLYGGFEHRYYPEDLIITMFSQR
eukprot:5335964-Amphidinium_carterae.2